MARRLSDETWLDIKTDYQLGTGIRDLERKYKVAASTIMSRKNKEYWTQKAHEKLQTIQRDVAEYVQEFAQEQLPFAQNQLDNVLDLQRQVNTFVAQAVKLNTMNLNAVINEPDHEKRINMTARMKATMPDLAGISQTRLQVPEDNPDNKDNNKLIIEYVRKNE